MNHYDSMSIAETINAHAIPRDVFQLSAAVTLECPDYKGSRLGESLVTRLCEVSGRAYNPGITDDHAFKFVTFCPF